jgi:plastocyanin
MFSTRRTALFLVASLLLSASQVFGGIKRTATIKFINNSSQVVGVTTDANNSAIQTAITDKSTTEFTAAGGKSVNAGATATFCVLAGSYTAGAIDGSFAFAIQTASVTVAKGQTVTFVIADDPNTSGAITLTQQ